MEKIMGFIKKHATEFVVGIVVFIFTLVTFGLFKRK